MCALYRARFPELVARQFANLALDEYERGHCPQLERAPEVLVDPCTPDLLAISGHPSDRVSTTFWQDSSRLPPANRAQGVEIPAACKMVGIPCLLEAPDRSNVFQILVSIVILAVSPTDGTLIVCLPRSRRCRILHLPAFCCV